MINTLNISFVYFCSWYFFVWHTLRIFFPDLLNISKRNKSTPISWLATMRLQLHGRCQILYTNYIIQLEKIEFCGKEAAHCPRSTCHWEVDEGRITEFQIICLLRYIGHLFGSISSVLFLSFYRLLRYKETCLQICFLVIYFDAWIITIPKFWLNMFRTLIIIF